MTDTLTIQVGFTQSDRFLQYSSFDGYLPGAEQDVRTFEVDVTGLPVAEPKVILNAVFEAANGFTTADGLVDRVYHAIYDDIEAGRAPRIRSLSVGDTVTVGEAGSYAVESSGFKKVTIVPADRAVLKAANDEVWAVRRARLVARGLL